MHRWIANRWIMNCEIAQPKKNTVLRWKENKQHFIATKWITGEELGLSQKRVGKFF